VPAGSDTGDAGGSGRVPQPVAYDEVGDAVSPQCRVNWHLAQVTSAGSGPYSIPLYAAPEH
jgi:hypothetical protein